MIISNMFRNFGATMVACALFIGGAVHVSAASEWYVNVNATGTADGMSAENAFTGIEAAVSAAVDGDTINVADGVYALAAQLNLSKSVTIAGQGSVTVKAATDFGTVGGSKHLLVAFPATDTNQIVVSNMTFDCESTNCYGLQAYGNANLALTNVTIVNSRGAALTVNGSAVTATGLSTSGNVWGAVNVDPGSGVTTPSVFTLASGTLAESNKIWSDGANVTETATVTVNAAGYQKYLVSGTPSLYVWSPSLTQKSAITRGDVTTIYSSIQAGLDAAISGETVTVYPGMYTETATNRMVNAASYQFGLFFGTSTVTLQGVGDVTVKTNATNNFGNSGTFIAADNVTISGITFAENIPGTNKTIEVIGDNFTLRDSKISEISGAVYISDFTTSQIVNKFTITNNVFDNASTISIASGAGTATSSPAGDRVITNNTFKGTTNDYARISFSGAGGQPWYVYPVGGAVITGNTFESDNKWHIRARGEYTEAQFDWKSIWENNSFTRAVLAVTNPETFSVRTYGYSSYTNVRSIGSDLAWTKANATSTDTILLKGFSEAPVTSASTTPEGKTATVESNTQLTATTTSGTVQAFIPAETVISGPTSWDGTFDLPVATTVFTLTPEQGFALSGTAIGIEIGAGDISLTFDKAIKLTFAGQAGKKVGWSRNGAFTHITNTCDSSTNPTLAAGDDCATTVGSDLVVWTKHATTFVVYSQVGVGGSGGGSSSGSTGGSSSSSASASTAPSSTAGTPATSGNTSVTSPTIGTVGQVLGATAFNFTANLGFGSRGTDVVELQKTLIEGGYLRAGLSTGYFGPLTKAAVTKWQRANSIPSTGFFGPLSRAHINAR